MLPLVVVMSSVGTQLAPVVTVTSLPTTTGIPTDTNVPASIVSVPPAASGATIAAVGAMLTLPPVLWRLMPPVVVLSWLSIVTGPAASSEIFFPAVSGTRTDVSGPAAVVTAIVPRFEVIDFVTV